MNNYKPINLFSENFINLIKNFEGFSPKIYHNKNDYPTIGYGHKMIGNEQFDSLNEINAENLLKSDLAKAWWDVKYHLEKPVSEFQAQALTSFVFNVGISKFASSTMLILLNSGNYYKVPNEFTRWIYQKGQILPGLVKRRKIEANWFIGCNS